LALNAEGKFSFRQKEQTAQQPENKSTKRMNKEAEKERSRER